MVGSLKVRDPADPTGNTWLPIATVGPAGATGATGATGEIGPTGPTGDTGAGIIAGGLANQVLAKASDADYDMTWGSVSGAIPPGGGIGVPLRKITAADGDVGWTGDVVLGAGESINFPNETTDKILLYSTTFGIGIDSGTTVLWIPTGNKVAFRAGSRTGTENASIGADGFIACKRVSVAGYLLSTTGAGVYVDSANDTNGHSWEVYRARGANARNLWHLRAVQGAVYGAGVEARYEMWSGNGYESQRRVMWTDLNATINCFFDGAVNAQQALIRSAPSESVTPTTALDGSAVSAAIDALHPIAFTRPVPPSDSDKPAALPTVEVGFDAADVAAAGIEGLVAGEGEEAAYSLNGLVAVLVAEVKTLRERVAQLEAGGA